MNVSYNWLKDYIDIDLDIARLSDVLTFSGIEVEAIRELKALPETVISAYISQVEKVPNSDHLHLCKVMLGDHQLADPSILNEDGSLDVVCGAPNCREGLKAVLALPGTQLGEITIKSAKLRGVTSHGMLCSEREIGISTNHDGIIELDADTPVGLSANVLYDLPDTVFELEITPNRSDLLGYIGIARDLSASLNVELKQPKPMLPEAHGDAPLQLLDQEPELCLRYIARVFDNVEIKPSPLWLKVRLIKSGLRPINDLVDITNYVLLATGQPLHAFDYDKLSKLNEADEYPSIIVRRANKDEKILALDGKEYALRHEDLVIADGKDASAIAGVMGGEITGVSAKTTRIVLESASFNHSAIRRTSYELKVSSDSSYRFERHLSDVSPDYASRMASELIAQLCGGKQVGQELDVWPSQSQETILGLRPERYTEIIGYALQEKEIITYLERLGCSFIGYAAWAAGCRTMQELELSELRRDNESSALYFRIPHYRIDLEREIDLIEELARLAGYERIPQLVSDQIIMDRHHYRTKKKIEDYLVSSGFYEVLNYSYEDPAYTEYLGYSSEESKRLIKLINPQSSNQGAMRPNLVPSVLTNIAYNLNRGERSLKLFETAKVYYQGSGKIIEENRITAILTGMDREENWKQKQAPLGVYHLKGYLADIIEYCGISKYCTAQSAKPYLITDDSISISVGDINIAEIGRINPQVAERFGIDLITLKQDLWVLDVSVDQIAELSRGQHKIFAPIPKFPAVIRDLSFLIEENVRFADLIEMIKGVDKEIIEDVSIFDEYRGKQLPKGSKSISLHLTLRDAQKTLTDERVDTLVASVLDLLKDKLHISLR